ncbi:DUF1376 domain-containing protein [Turicimonas muris]|uniref:DUF1376 domain-containing protein n=1 Tax=Turicimonas muris TaxID=1796652 RepID=UPI0023F43C8F|nr:DUF1376 domain-containing protein [Turicimonas muris]
MPQAELKAQNFYPIKSDEYTTDFLQLTTTQAGCLFKLRTAYFFSKNPLSPEQVAYLCPAVTEQDQQAREFVLSKYFTFSGGFYHSELMEEKIYLAKQEQEILEAEEKARKIRSEKARKKAMSRWGTIEKEMPQHVLQHKNENATAYAPAHATASNSDESMPQHVPQHKNENATAYATAYAPAHATASNPDESMLQHMPQHKNENATAYATAYAPAHATASLLPGKSSETPEHQAVSGDSKNSEKTVQSTSHAYAHARTDPMSDIRSVCINNLINNKQHRSVSVSGSGSDLENTVRDLFNRENTPWTVDEVLQTMTFFGLDAKSLERWRKRSQENETAVAELAQTGMPGFDFETVAQVFARCQQAKDKEGKSLSSAVAFVVKSLQRELSAIRNRKLAAKAAKPEDEAEPAETQDPYDVSGMIRNPNGSYRFGPKRSSYADRDYTAGLIQNPDGTYRIAPRPRKS